MKKVMKARQSTERPNYSEMRIIGGVVKIWDGKKWLTQSEWGRLQSENLKLQ